MSKDRVFTALFPFCGLGGGALGFARAESHLFGRTARFRVVGGIDNDAPSCADFERLTGAPALRADVARLTPEELRQLCPESPDVVFLSPPCKGASGLLSSKAARSVKYQRMNRLALVWTELMLRTWERPPALVLLENVPRLKKRAATPLRRIRAALRAAGYVFTDGFHDCGELGGLAQVRRRYLMVARHRDRVPPLLYQPPKKRVRGCGEVIGPMPMPGAPEGGPMHTLPRLSWLNWVRLALIPAGGDWRDLEGVLKGEQPRREVFRRHKVQRWSTPADTVTGSGSNASENVADPRIAGASMGEHWNKMRVEAWNEPAHAVTGSDRVGSRAPSVADPRVLVPARGAFDNGYGVLDFREPSPTIAGGSDVGQGAYSVADPRVQETRDAARLKGPYYNGTFGVMSWQDAAGTITGNARHDTGRFVVADPRKPPDFTPIIIAADGTWHRPLTTLELAALQGLPTELDGKPLVLHGTSHSGWRERIGNAVPPPAAQAIAERMLVALLQAEAEGFALAGLSTPVWVDQPSAEVQA